MGSAAKPPLDTHQIITNDDDQFVVWSDSRKLPLGWRYVGRAGTRAELMQYLKDMLVETVPAPLRLTRPAGDSRWAD
jgi:MbtH protein